MQFARGGGGAAARADADGRHGMPNPSLHSQMMMEALRRELWEEGFRQGVIAAELAARRELEARFRTEPGSYRGVPLQFRAGFQPITLRTHTGTSMSGRTVKDRIEEWYRPPWHRKADEEDASYDGARLHKKALSGVKRKRTAETLLFVCGICNVKCTSESDLQNHLRGRRHQGNIEALQKSEDEGIEAMLYEKKVPQLAEENQKPVSRWMCSICGSNCSPESDLENHLRGRRHQENIETLHRSEGKGIEAKLHEKKAPQLPEKSQKPVSRSMCSICKVHCSSESVLENHLKGRRHQKNIENLHRSEGKGIESKLHGKKAPQLAEKNQKPVLRWTCSICKVYCSSESVLDNHLKGRRHQENIENLQKSEGKGIESKLNEKKAPQLAEKNQKPVSRWMCSICKVHCNSESDLENHLGGRRHQRNVKA